MQPSKDTTEGTANTGYTLDRLSRENLGDLAILHAAVYGKKVPPGFFEKKYDTAFTGVEYVGLIAYNADRVPVAFYGVIPCYITDGVTRVLAAQSADTMTHPQHRFKGMFVDLSLRVFELCRQVGIRLLFGFPNQHSYHGAVNKLGWIMTDSMSCFRLPIHTMPIERISSRTAFSRMAYQFYRRMILTGRRVPLKGLENRIVSEGFAGLERDENFLTYKQYSPSLVVQVGNGLAWLSKKNGLLGDLSGINRENFADVIQQLKKIMARMGITELQFHCSPGIFIHEMFAGICDPSPSYPMLFQDFGSPIPPEKIKFTFSDIDVF